MLKSKYHKNKYQYARQWDTKHQTTNREWKNEATKHHQIENDLDTNIKIIF